MRHARQFLCKLGGLFRRAQSDGLLDREIAAHLQMLEEDLCRQGLSAEEAHFRALREFGGREQTKESYRDTRTFVGLEQLWQDIRHAVRNLRNNPGFSAVAIISLALGIGVTSAVFTFVHGILLQQLPVARHSRIVQLQARMKAFTSNGFSYPQFDALRRQSSIFSEVIGFCSHSPVLDANGEGHPVSAQLVTGNFFRFFHAEPVLGRLLDEEDDRVEGAHAVCVVSYHLWHTRFGSDLRVLGRTVLLNKKKFEVIGVAGPHFVGPELQFRHDLWVPTAMAEVVTGNARGSSHFVWLGSLATLRPGISDAEAHARIAAASKAINEQLPKDRANADASFDFTDGSAGSNGLKASYRKPLWVLMSAVLLVLLIACANLTNLLLARSSARRQEFSVKLSLGLSRARLIRQLLTESFLLALAGGALGLVLARALLVFLLNLVNTGTRVAGLYLEIDRPVLLFTLAVCTLTTLLVGLNPALSAADTDLAAVLKSSTAAGLQNRWTRRVLIVVQVSIAVVLLFGATLLERSLRELQTVNLGYDIDHVAIVEIEYRNPDAKLTLPSDEKLYPIVHDVPIRIREIEGVESVSFVNPAMLSHQSMTNDVQAQDPKFGLRKVENVHFVFCTPPHFTTLRMKLLAGRDFTDRDRRGAPPVAIVNSRLASLLWPGQNPLGKVITGGWNNENPQVTGVVADSKYVNVRESAVPIIYEPLAQSSVVGFDLEIRTHLRLGEIEQQVRKLVNRVPDFQVAEVSSMELLRDRTLAQDRLLACLSGLFGALGTCLALVGIYGLISYSVSRRTREIGIRMGIGARSTQVIALVLKEAILLVACSVALGLPVAFLLSRTIQSFLYEVTTLDKPAIAVTLLLIVLGSLAASFLPARRATRIDVMEALRHE
jgi:predicted permease